MQCTKIFGGENRETGERSGHLVKYKPAVDLRAALEVALSHVKEMSSLSDKHANKTSEAARTGGKSGMMCARIFPFVTRNTPPSASACWGMRCCTRYRNRLPSKDTMADLVGKERIGGKDLSQTGNEVVLAGPLGHFDLDHLPRIMGWPS